MKKIFLLAAVTLALAACDNNDDISNQPSGIVNVTATIGESTLSRASDDKWSAGDEIGISSTLIKEDGTSVSGPYINEKYTTTSGDGNFTGTPLYYYPSMTLTAYYPFTSPDNIDSNGKITAYTTVEYQTADKQPKIDFLWDGESSIHKNADGKPGIDFNFSHKMSKLTLTFKKGDDAEGSVDVSKIISYEIEGLKLEGKFDTKTGVCAVNNEAVAQLLSINPTVVENGVPLPSLILFPQTPGTDKVKLHIYTNEIPKQHYVCTLSFSSGGVIEKGNSYQYTITVNKTGLTINQSNITNWTTPDPEENNTESAD